MNKVLMAMGVIVVLIAGGAYLVLSNLDEIVRVAIENYGSEAVGTQVSVGSVDLDLTAGSASIYDFSVANPEGFSDQEMMRFSEVSVVLDIATIGDPTVGINSVIARDPYVLYESANGTTNVDAVSERFASDEETVEDSSESEAEIELSIASIVIENIQAQMAGEGIPDLRINLGDIRLQNLEGTPDEIASQVMGPVMQQISVNAASALLEATAEMITDAVESATESLEEVGDTISESLGEGLDNVGDALEESLEGLGNLLGN